MAIDILTKSDLDEFRQSLLKEIGDLLTVKKPKEHREWLKTYEVLSLLDISKSTLHQLRINGTLAYSRIGHCIYYKYSDISALLEKNVAQYPKSTGLKGRNRYSMP